MIARGALVLMLGAVGCAQPCPPRPAHAKRYVYRPTLRPPPLPEPVPRPPAGPHRTPALNQYLLGVAVSAPPPLPALPAGARVPAGPGAAVPQFIGAVPDPASFRYVEACDAAEPDAAAPTAVDAGDGPRLQAAGDAHLAEANLQTTHAFYGIRLTAAHEAYRAALLTSPYSPTLTLALALTYERFYRKGCALGMLERLAALADSPQHGATAEPVVEKVLADPHMFEGYRAAAVSALGR